MSNDHNDYHPNSESIRTYYNAVLQRLLNLHDTIWEEIKHFSWLLSLLLGGPFAFLMAENGETLFFRYGWIFSGLASVIALTGARIIHREGEHFLAFDYYLLRAEWALGLHHPHPILQKLGGQDDRVVPEHRRKYFVETESCEEFVRRQNHFRSGSIRWLFTLLFLVYAVVAGGLFTWILIHNIVANP